MDGGRTLIAWGVAASLFFAPSVAASVRPQATTVLYDGALGTPPEARLAIDDPAALLVAAAEASADPALIVVGSRGLGAFQRFRLGSTSTKVLHAAQCPVLIAPGEQEEAAR